MKKRLLFLCCLCLTVLLTGCKKDTPHICHDDNEVRKAAWDILGPELQATVTIPWEEAYVEHGKFDVYNFLDKEFKKHYCYCVSFRNEQDALLGPIRIFLDICTLKYLGTTKRI